MTPNDFVTVLIATITLSSGLVYFALKERIKNSLRVDFDTKLENVKHELQINAQEHQIQFSRLHERIADGITETYRLLKKAHWAVGDYVSILETSDSPRETRRDAVSNAMQEFNEAYYKIKLFLPKTADEKVFKIAIALREISHDFAIHCDIPERSDRDISKWTEIFKTARDGFEPAFLALESAARDLLGTDRLFPSTSVGIDAR